MRILFIHPNYRSGGAEIAGNWPPAWVAYLTGSLRRAGFDDIDFIDAMTNNITDVDLGVQIAALAPDVVGGDRDHPVNLSGRTGAAHRPATGAPRAAGAGRHPCDIHV